MSDATMDDVERVLALVRGGAETAQGSLPPGPDNRIGLAQAMAQAMVEVASESGVIERSKLRRQWLSKVDFSTLTATQQDDKLANFMARDKQLIDEALSPMGYRTWKSKEKRTDGYELVPS